MTTASTDSHATSGFASIGPSGWCSWSRAALAYLALPNLLFVAAWFAPAFALPAIGALLLALRPVMQGKPGPDAVASPARVIGLLLVACTWSAFGGAGHLFHANSDWVVRDAVLRDLVVGDWPVGYPAAGGDLVMRAPIAHYLPAALVGKALGLAFADIALLAWTIVGVWIFLVLAAGAAGSTARLATTVGVVVLFSGMDIAGALLDGDRVSLGDHLEAWAVFFQYSSSTTQLFWVPAHALPGWLGAILVMRSASRPGLVRGLPAMLALVPMWSPLVAIGLAPLAAIAFLRAARGVGARAALDLPAACGAAILAAGVAAYLGSDSARIPAGWYWRIDMSEVDAIDVYCRFLLLEVAVPMIVLMRHDRSAVMRASVVSLILLPSFMFGPSNDFAMRASIPALMVITLSLAEALPVLAAGGAAARGAAVAAAFSLAIGTATPISEFIRAVSAPRWPPDADTRLADVLRDPHYFARLSEGWIAGLLRPVHRLQRTEETR